MNQQGGQFGISISIPIEAMRARRLFLATPMYGGQCAGMFAKSSADLAAKCAYMGINLQLYYLFNESLITRARNYCCDQFMRSDATHLLFIDSDIGYNPDDALAMMAMQSDDSEYDVLAAPYPKKTISWEKIVRATSKGWGDPQDPVPDKRNPNSLERFVGDFVFNPKAGHEKILIGQPAQVLEAGTGFMMIRKPAMKKFMESYPEFNYRPDHVRTADFDGRREVMMFFQSTIDRQEAFYRACETIQKKEDMAADDIRKLVAAAFQEYESGSKRYLSEDYWFCQRAQDLGLKIWLCPWMKTYHVGSYVFSGSLADIAAIGANPTADAGEMDRIKQLQGQLQPQVPSTPLLEKR